MNPIRVDRISTSLRPLNLPPSIICSHREETRDPRETDCLSLVPIPSVMSIYPSVTRSLYGSEHCGSGSTLIHFDRYFSPSLNIANPLWTRRHCNLFPCLERGAGQKLINQGGSPLSLFQRPDSTLLHSILLHGMAWFISVNGILLFLHYCFFSTCTSHIFYFHSISFD